MIIDLRQQTMYIYGFLFPFTFTFMLYTGFNAGHFIIIITGIFSLAVYEQVFLLKYQVLALVLCHLKIGYQLNGIRGTGFFTIAAENATGKIDAKEFRISSPILIFGSLK